MTNEQLLALTHKFLDRLRKETIGKPGFLIDKHTFEYDEKSIRVVVVLKLIRAAQGTTALECLRQAGLFVDLGATIRSVQDCVAEVYFLLENFPNSSPHVDKFVEGFFRSTIDQDLSTAGSSVQSAQLHSAMVRVLKGTHDHETTQRIKRIYRTFSGYIHSNYAHIMEIYSGATDSFNLAGVRSDVERERRAELVNVVINSVLDATAFAAEKLGLPDLRRDVVASWQNT